MSLGCPLCTLHTPACHYTDPAGRFVVTQDPQSSALLVMLLVHEAHPGTLAVLEAERELLIAANRVFGGREAWRFDRNRMAKAYGHWHVFARSL